MRVQDNSISPFIPLIRLLTMFAATFPQGVKAFALDQAPKVAFRVNLPHILYFLIFICYIV